MHKIMLFILQMIEEDEMWRLHRGSIHQRIGRYRQEYDSPSPPLSDEDNANPQFPTYFDEKTGVHRQVRVERTIERGSTPVEHMDDHFSSDYEQEPHELEHHQVEHHEPVPMHGHPQDWGHHQHGYPPARSEMIHLEVTQRNNIHLEVSNKRRRKRKKRRRERVRSPSLPPPPPEEEYYEQQVEVIHEEPVEPVRESRSHHRHKKSRRKHREQRALPPPSPSPSPPPPAREESSERVEQDSSPDSSRERRRRQRRKESKSPDFGLAEAIHSRPRPRRRGESSSPDFGLAEALSRGKGDNEFRLVSLQPYLYSIMSHALLSPCSLLSPAHNSCIASIQKERHAISFDFAITGNNCCHLSTPWCLTKFIILQYA